MSEAPTNPTPTLSHADVRSIIIGLMLAILLGALDQTIISVSLPMMSAELHGVDLLAWVVSGYLIAVAVATPIYGKLGDLYGRRVMLSSAIGIFLLASVLCAMATSMPMLVGSRILQGLGGGGLISVAQAIIADVVSPRERGRYQGYISTAYAVASVTGPLAGGMLTEYASWRWIFWINLPLGLAAFFISRKALTRLHVPHVKRPIDYLGALFLIAGLTALLIAVTRAGQGMSWVAPDNLNLLATAAVCIGIFVWQERRAAEPIIPLSLLGNKTVALSCLILFIAFFQIIALSVLIPLRLQMLTTAGADGAAIQLVPLSLAMPLGTYICGTLMTRFGRYKHLQLTGMILVTITLVLIAFTDPNAILANTIYTALAGLGIGLQLPTSTVAAQNAVAHQHLGVTTAITAFSRSVGAAIGIAVLMAVLFATLQAHAPAALTLSATDIVKQMVGDASSVRLDAATRAQLTVSVGSAFQKVFLISAAIAAVSIVLGIFIPNKLLSDKQPQR